MRINYVVVFVRDLTYSVSFYRDVIGVPLRFESPGWTEFATDGATLALHLAGEDHPSGGEEVRPGVCRPGFQVPNLTDFHQRMLAGKVRCIQEPKEVFGARVAQYADPDGLAFSVGEAMPGR